MSSGPVVEEKPGAKLLSKLRGFNFVDSTKIWGGEERFVFDLATGLKSLGYPVVVYGRSGTEFFSRLVSVGLETQPVFPKFDYDFFPLRKFFASTNDEIFIAITPRDFKLLRMFGFFRPKAKCYWHLGVAYSRPSREYRWLFKNENLKLITPSNYLKSRVLSDFPQLEHRISVLPNGVGVSDSDPLRARRVLAEKFGVSSDKLFLGIFSRLTGWKGHSLLFQALRRVKNDGVDFHLWVVGGGEKERFEREARDLEIAERITFTGHQTDVASFMAGADIACLPSQIDYSPYVVLEAMALGKAVLASKVGGLPEMIQNEKDGLLLSPQDPAAWAFAITALARNAIKRKELGKAAQRSVRERFSPEQMVSGFLKIIDADFAVGRA